jgi:hypothetical protein
MDRQMANWLPLYIMTHKKQLFSILLHVLVGMQMLNPAKGAILKQ